MKTIPLTPIDHIFTGVGSYPIEFVFAYGDTIDPDRLLASLNEAVRHFVAIGSTLAEVSENTYSLHRVEDGVHFQVTESAPGVKKSCPSCPFVRKRPYGLEFGGQAGASAPDGRAS